MNPPARVRALLWLGFCRVRDLQDLWDISGLVAHARTYGTWWDITGLGGTYRDLVGHTGTWRNLPGLSVLPGFEGLMRLNGAY